MTKKVREREVNQTRGYTVELRQEEDGSWSALVPELPGCIAVGDTPNDAIADLPTVIDLWIASARDRNMAVPPPRVDTEVSGRLLLRMPKDLHRALVNRARVEGVSLNTYVVSALSVKVGESFATRTRHTVAPDVYWQRAADLKFVVAHTAAREGIRVEGVRLISPKEHLPAEVDVRTRAQSVSTWFKKFGDEIVTPFREPGRRVHERALES